jgi:hypothetical protein
MGPAVAKLTDDERALPVWVSERWTSSWSGYELRHIVDGEPEIGRVSLYLTDHEAVVLALLLLRAVESTRHAYECDPGFG